MAAESPDEILGHVAGNQSSKWGRAGNENWLNSHQALGYLTFRLVFPWCLPWYWASAEVGKPLSGAERRGMWWRERKRGEKKVKLFAERSLLASHTDPALYRLHPFSCNTRQIDITTGGLFRICVWDTAAFIIWIELFYPIRDPCDPE